MAPFVATALPFLIEAAPALIRLFGNGEQSEKNAKAAEAVAELAKQVTGEPTVEGATQAIQSDAELSARFSEEVEAQWYTLAGEAGGGGIEGARKADQKARESDGVFFSPAMVISFLLLPLVYMVVGSVLFREGWANDIKAMVVASVISGVLGAITGFFLGTSYGSQRKTELMGK